MTDEIWRDIDGYEGLYQVSNFGRVKSFQKGTVRILKPAINRKWLFVVLCKNGGKKIFKVHRLVAMAFIPNPDGKPQVNHIDGNPQNNHVDNLEWCTPSENMQHALRTGLIATGEKNYQAGVTNEQAREIRELYKPHDEQFGTVALSKKYGLSDETIGMIVHGETYRQAGGRIHLKNQPKIPIEVRTEIRALYQQGNISYRKLATEYRCGKTTIKRIIHEND